MANLSDLVVAVSAMLGVSVVAGIALTEFSYRLFSLGSKPIEDKTRHPIKYSGVLRMIEDAHTSNHEKDSTQYI